jgi:hypothetical protein
MPVATAGRTTGDLFVRGVVHRDGRPVKTAAVLVSAMPEDLDVPAGSIVKTWRSREVRTASDGSFDVRIKPSQVPSEYFSPTTEHLNFDLQVVDGDDFASWSWTLSPLDDGGTWRTLGSDADGSVARADFDFGDKPTVVITDSAGQQEKHELPMGKGRR